LPGYGSLVSKAKEETGLQTFQIVISCVSENGERQFLAKSPADIDLRDKSARFYLCTIFKAAENDPQAIIGYRSIGRKVANGYLDYVHFCGWGRSFFCLERKNPLGSMKELKRVTRRIADFRN
jgi:hypothetical protein